MSKTYTVPVGSEIMIDSDHGLQRIMKLTIGLDALIFTEDDLEYVGEEYIIFTDVLLGASVYIHVKKEDIIFEIPVGEKI